MTIDRFQQTERRYRRTQQVRNLFASVHLQKDQMMTPLFIQQSLKQKELITSLTDQYRHNQDSLFNEVDKHLELGLKNFLLFFVPERPVGWDKSKDFFNYEFEAKCLFELKKRFADEIIVATDVCLCSHSASGHCGISDSKGNILNHQSVLELTERALVLAEAGADILAPSDMMDGRILSIKNALAQKNLENILLMSYSTKFSSHFYGPFRHACDSSPQYGDRKTYQLDPANPKRAISASLRDIEQGADIVMVKPAMAYLDMVYQLKNHPLVQNYPLAAYHVSGEYQALHALAQAGLLDFKSALKESLLAIKRAGADIIITYGAFNLFS